MNLMARDDAVDAAVSWRRSGRASWIASRMHGTELKGVVTEGRPGQFRA
ncbi:MAG: hypothetical protein JWR01_2949, partial [Subtercola sp.]|nr:hypothetical protein [Subtercola sp.]